MNHSDLNGILSGGQSYGEVREKWRENTAAIRFFAGDTEDSDQKENHSALGQQGVIPVD
jgi:hypothetical protein